MLLYSGHEENKAAHTQGVALMMSEEASNAFVGWGSHGSGIIKAEGRDYNECYAPTNDSNGDDKDQFYKRLQLIIAKCSGTDLTILMADLSA
ncbi:unnamed protein product [Schistosoma curassoni]|uniref:Pectate lyase n=1 Tax=Schistosoma curassoni TaxID=6186 RepID=A0A183JG15_9TREM|nr:unnamed protein product [Schistosoma curassoni]